METAEGVIVGWYIFRNQKCHQKWRKSRNDSNEKRRSNIRRRSLLRVRLRSQHIRCFRLPFQPHFRFHQGTRAPRRFPRESRNIPFPFAAASWRWREAVELANCDDTKINGSLDSEEKKVTRGKPENINNKTAKGDEKNSDQQINVNPPKKRQSTAAQEKQPKRENWTSKCVEG